MGALKSAFGTSVALAPGVGVGVGGVCLVLYERTARKPLQPPHNEHGESLGDGSWKVWKEVKYNSI